MTVGALGSRIARRKGFAQDIVIVDGLSKAAKRMMATVVSSLERCEPFLQSHTIFQELAWLDGAGLIDREVAIALLQTHADVWMYQLQLGRHANFRPGDYSSVLQSRNPAEFLQRLYEPEGQPVLDRIAKSRPWLVVLTHHVLCHSRLFFDAFANFRAVLITRHPVDVVSSWHKNGWGWRDGRDPLAFALTLQGPSGPVPHFAHGWEAEYESLSEMGRIIRSVHCLTERYRSALSALSESDRGRVLPVLFDKLVTAPEPVVAEICAFLDTAPSPATQTILTRERIPRQLSPADREAKLAAIAQHASPSELERLTVLARLYEEMLLW